MSMWFRVVGILVPVAYSRTGPDIPRDIKLWPLPTKLDIAQGSGECRLDNRFHYSINGDSVGSSGHLSNLKAAIEMRNKQLVTLFGLGNSVQPTRLGGHQQRSLSPDPSVSLPACTVSVCELHVKSFSSGISADTVSESYEIHFSEPSACSITCPTVYGCMHGMVTLAQMVDPTLGFRIPTVFSVQDQPAYPHRGLLLDTSRHYMSESVIMEHLELMSEAKMNVFHWHVVDDHSFPLVLAQFPELAQKGAYSAKAVYSKDAVERILARAGTLGIKVIPELDMPGHTWSWFKSHGELEGIAKGAIDPTRDENYVWIEQFLGAVISLFSPSTFLGLKFSGSKLIVVKNS